MYNILHRLKITALSNSPKLSSEYSVKYLLAIILAMLIGFGTAFLTGCNSLEKNTYATYRDDNRMDDFQTGADNPPSANTLYAYANILQKQGKIQQSEMILNKLVQDYPYYRPAYLSLADIQVDKGYIDLAIDILDHAAMNNPNDPVIINNIGMCLMIRQDYEAALKRFTTAAGLAPDNARYRANAAVALGMQRRYEEALAIYQSILPPAQAHYNLAVLCQTNKDEDLAQQYVSIARQYNPSLTLAAK